MKLYVVVLLAVAGITAADDTTPRICTVTLDEDEEMHTKMAGMALGCLATDKPVIEQIKSLTTLEEHKKLFKDNYCDKKQQIRECLARVADTSEVCQGETHHKFWLLLREFFENVLDSGCVQDGEIVAAMFLNYNSSDTELYEADHFHYCVKSAMSRLARLMDKDIEPHTRFFILYREVMITTECFDDITDGDVTLMKQIASILDDITNKMKCMHPVEETPVLCKAIDVHLPNVPRICPIKVEDETKHSMKDDLMMGISWCLTSTFLDEDGLKTIDTLERGWRFFVHHCAAKEEFSKCLSEVTTLSSVCLDDAQHMTVKLVNDVLQHAVDALCIVDDGHAGGYVMFKVLSKPDATLRHNAITDCMHSAHKHHEESKPHIDAANFLNLHHELKAFKQCLINELKGDNRAVFDAHLFLSSVERKMKCLDQEHGTMVLCDTLDTTPQTELTVCPFVGQHEDEPPKYSRLVDMAILCLKTSEMELDPVKRYTTLTQFQTFFKTFCPKRRAVIQCYDDIAAYSKVCMDLPNHNMLTVFTDLFGRALESGCQHDGEIFSTVVNGLLVDDNDLRVTCLNETTSGLEKDQDPTTKPVAEASRFYHGLLVSMNDCIIRGASDEGTFKTVYSTLTNELLKDVKCIHPDDGTLVSCETTA